MQIASLLHSLGRGDVNALWCIPESVLLVTQNMALLLLLLFWIRAYLRFYTYYYQILLFLLLFISTSKKKV